MPSLASWLRAKKKERTDRYIGRNIRRFQRTVNPVDVASTKRPIGWQNHIEMIIPCFNHGPFLRSAFKSILWQTDKRPLTVTFVNDASTDESVEVMRSIRKSNPAKHVEVRIIDNQINLNQAGSINKAVNESNNHLFMMLNADDLLTPDCLELTLTTYRQNPDIFLLGGSSLWFEDEGELPNHRAAVTSPRLTKYGPAEAAQFSSLNDINMSQSSCSFFKSAWSLVGGYWERQRRVCSFDDRDFQMRVCSLLPIGVYKDYPMEFYRTTSSTGRATV